MNVHLLTGSPNRDPNAVYSSRACGEPPVALAASVFFAIKDAMSSARSDIGLHGPYRLDAPATPRRVRLLFEDDLLTMNSCP